MVTIPGAVSGQYRPEQVAVGAARLARPLRTGCHPYGSHAGIRPAAANLGVRSTFGQQARRAVRAGRGPMPESASS